MKRHTQSKKTVDARKEGMFLGKIISSRLMGKKKLLIITQSILEIKLKFLGKILDGSYSEALTLHVHNSLKAENKSKVASRWPLELHPVAAGY